MMNHLYNYIQLNMLIYFVIINQKQKNYSKYHDSSTKLFTREKEERGKRKRIGKGEGQLGLRISVKGAGQEAEQ